MSSSKYLVQACCAAVPHHADRHAHHVRLVPAADFGSRALRFKVEHDHVRTLLGRRVLYLFLFLPLGKNRRVLCDLGCGLSTVNGPAAREYAEQVDRAGLVEGDVARAARGEMDARGAAKQDNRRSRP